MQRRDRSIAQSLGLPTIKKVKESRVLLVGAGGIGCELLKNLVCCGFGTGLKLPQNHNAAQPAAAATEGEQPPAKKAEIVVIDLDTIDLSNLNRQFLFRKQHIKKPKATVAKETASQFNPAVNIDAHHASIFDSQYNVEFFEGFDLVFNALDNLAARRHVNKMCLAADVALIESGTTGFNGQVQAIKKGITECYDCNEKPVTKSFPICTIRSTPSQPIHCIVWAKSYLLPELFGTSEEDSSDMQVTEGDNAEEVAKLKEEAEALKNIRSLMGKSEFAQAIFNKVFHDDIERLRSMAEMWQTRKAPDALRFESVCIDTNPTAQGEAIASQDQNVWTLQDNLKVFCYAVKTLSKRIRSGKENVIEFDKDDKDTLDFVTAAANLRSHIFGIELNTEWDVKQMAGNIIPAIATSNALTASLCVLEAFKIFKSELPSKRPATNNGAPNTPPLLGGAKMTFLTSKSTDRMITSQNLVEAKPDCPVCSPFYAKIHIKQDSSPTLQQLVDLLKRRLDYEDFSITADAGMIYDPDLEENLPKALKDFGIDGKSIGFLTIQDDSDEPRVDLQLAVIAKELDSDELVLLPQSIELGKKPPKKTLINGENLVEAKSDPDPALEPGSSTKRKRDAEEMVESAKKKAKADKDEPVYVVEDDGAILLDN
ncbi:Ubiquitin-activating enzyme E1-like [Fulvia fulva]|uniref:Ubiquitin-activating enzyme E1-like n=1 Tax=Passalora fulva TaxID=5499 RepID=A0A9Q8PDR5_PASFU|nr:Ubiquitin-activating enzyme E1-like [Fulvia fulva]KAK4617911.1 Ubiquitin-activating enzyme E1-like [Fulvia fulva]KAK4618872.1 Ubiquitin-activating enzyme E1-like [Fulvia fulva]UJO20580.1 Ubiquitin-activating enzyme E1-like [Fulvia fulva]WPV18601.1 Ubiquitin-activating enzyme E1-like [Fulvia fulva]WPV32742.1 Ubiquitin-activating enzyme E1-like [Fulvia fulva]